MNKPPIARHEHWRHVYREHRYCEHLTKDELDERISNIMTNMLLLTPEAKIGLSAIEDGGGLWMELFTHVLEEMVLRHGPYPNGFSKDIFQNSPLPDFTGELGKKAAKVVSARNLRSGQFLIKYGDPMHMKHLIEDGNIRVQSASFYRSTEHNEAVRDDETALLMSLRLTRDDIIKIVKNPEDVPENINSQRLDFSHIYQSDYWLYCMTESAQPRLFVDFDATACVVISNREEFIKRISTAMSKHKPGIKFRAGLTEYVDPLLPNKGIIDVPISKHFKYTYQKEYRIIWEQKENHDTLGHIDLNIGCIADIAELIAL